MLPAAIALLETGYPFQFFDFLFSGKDDPFRLLFFLPDDYNSEGREVESIFREEDLSNHKLRGQAFRLA